MQNLHIDNDTPTDKAIIIEDREQLALSHGAIVTRFNFNQVERMDLQTFITDVVPSLQPDEQKLTVIRSADTGNYGILLGDMVFRYSITDVEETDIKKVLDFYSSKSEKTFKPQCPYPIIFSAVNKSDVEVLTVQLPERTQLFTASWLKKSIPMHLPPLWFSLRWQGHHVSTGKLAVVGKTSVDCDKTTLLRWPLSNVFDDGRICFGVSCPSAFKATQLGDIVNEVSSWFFDAQYNTDLLDRVLLLNLLQEAEQMPEVQAAFTKYIERTLPPVHVKQDDAVLVTKMACVLSVPKMWLRLSLKGWSHLQVSNKEFYRNGI